jgi:hypothetical protein
MEWSIHEMDDGEIAYRKSGDDALEFELRDDGDVTVSGMVKWDGCMNWETSKECMYHFCDPEHSLSLHKKFLKVWDLARNEIPWSDF